MTAHYTYCSWGEVRVARSLSKGSVKPKSAAGVSSDWHCTGSGQLPAPSRGEWGVLGTGETLSLGRENLCWALLSTENGICLCNAFKIIPVNCTGKVL